MEKLNVISDADLINEFGKQAMEGPAPVINTQAPSSDEVTLLAGVLVGSAFVNTAEVRELTGADEEKISKAGSIGKTLSMILRLGVTSIGGFPVTDTVIDSLLAGDRDHLLLAIRQATFGKTIESKFPCPECGRDTNVSIDLATDIPTTPFDGRWQWDVETKLGVVTVGYYNGITHNKIMDNLDKTPAELSSIVLAGCIRAVNGEPVFALDVARKLGIGDRDKLMLEVTKNAPGPRLLEVTKACEACGKDIPLPLSLASLFRL